MKLLLISIASLLFVSCSPDISPLPPNWIPLDDGGIVEIEPDGGLEPVLDAGEWLDAGIEIEDAGASVDAGIDLDAGWFDPTLDAGTDAGYSDGVDAGVCKNGHGWGDKNHCHKHR